MARKSTRPPASASRKPRLLAGGNPQIPKGEGDAPVQAYIAALPGWKQASAARIDALIETAVPGVRKAVKWNSPFYGVQDQGWFLSMHAFKHYLKLAFFKGAALDPQPPVGSTSDEVRYLHVGEDEPLDEAAFLRWLGQAARLPGWMA